MSFPADATWSSVYITVGAPTDGIRPYRGFSQFKTLTLELKGEHGGETVQVGLKDSTDPDNGKETTVTIDNLGTQWQTYNIPLSSFQTADKTKLYVVTEFVYNGAEAQTVYFRNTRHNYIETAAIPTATPTPTSTPTATPTPTPTSTPTPTPSPTPTPTPENGKIYVGATLSAGYDMGVDSSSDKTDCVTNMDGYMRVSYPSGQTWGAVFITVWAAD